MNDVIKKRIDVLLGQGELVYTVHGIRDITVSKLKLTLYIRYSKAITCVQHRCVLDSDAESHTVAVYTLVV